MKPRFQLAALVFALRLVAGCGKSADGDEASSGPVTEPVAVLPQPVPATVNRLIEAVPVETYWTDSWRIPERLKLRTLKINFSSNIDGARFECKPGQAREFVACPSGESWYQFTEMADGSSQTLSVRARSPLGDVDTTPLQISFVVDVNHGFLPLPPLSSSATGNVTQVNVPASAKEVFAAQHLPLGRSFSVAVPAAAPTVIASYATDKTVSGRLLTMRLLKLSKRPCNQTYEAVVTLAAGADYCEATPSLTEYLAGGGEALPRNHLEVITFEGKTAKLSERLLLAAFDQDKDPAEAVVLSADLCRGALASGQITLGLIKDFFGGVLGRRLPGQLDWCEVRDQAGEFWWISMFRYESPSGQTRLKGIYVASAGLGIFSGQDFAQRTSTLIGELVVPLSLLP